MAESAQVLETIIKSKDITHNAYKTIEIEHAEIHSGNGYIVFKSTTILGASSWIDIQINCNSTTKYIHLKNIDANNSAGLCQVLMFAMVSSTASTWANSTTALTVFNKNKNSSNSAAVTFGYQPSLITSTCYTVIDETYSGSTGTASGGRAVGISANEEETLLRLGSTYVARLLNLGPAGYATLRLFFYED